jgi:hypothetical protein
LPAITTVGVVLTSGIYPGPFDQDLYATNGIAAASDGSLWITSDDGLMLFSASQGGFVDASSSPPFVGSSFGPSIAPVRAALAYYMTGAGGIVSYDAGSSTTIAALPNGAAPSAITASPDGTLWALASGTDIYAYDASANAWSAVAAPPVAPVCLSVQSADAALALVQQNGTSSLYAYANGTWTAATTFCPPDASWLGACYDGSYWVADATGPTLVLANGTTQPFPLPAGMSYFGGYTAGSRYACYFFGMQSEPVPPAQIGIFFAGYGVTEQPAESWPAMTPDQQTAYAAINTDLGIEDPGGVRATYTNLDATLSDYYSTVQTMACPAGVTAADWAIVQQQILNELEYAQAVQNLFLNIALLNVEVAQIQLAEYADVVQMVGLPDNPNQQPQTLVQVILGALVTDLFNAALGAAPSAVQQLISVGMSIYNAAATYEAQKHSVPDRNQALTIACAQLAGTLADMQTEAVNAAATFETAILSDWGMLQACGLAVKTNFWYWPPNFNVDILQNAGAANALSFYQALMPVKWQIMQLQTIFLFGPSGGGLTAPPNVPQYALIGAQEIDSNYNVFGWWLVITDQGLDPVPQTNGPFPNESLIEAVMALLGSNQQSFFTNTDGWNFPVATMDGYSPLPSNLVYGGWVDSASPISQ